MISHEETYKSLYIDASMGIAGDMFAGALLSLGAPEDGILDMMSSAAESLGGAEIGVTWMERERTVPWCAISVVTSDSNQSLHLSRAEIALDEALVSGGVVGPYRDFACRALAILGEAEAEAHRGPAFDQMHEDHDHSSGHEHAEVHLHEAQDIIVDVAGAAWALQRLDVDLDMVRCIRPVRVGGGSVHCSHGILSVPAPATALILQTHHIPWMEGPKDFEQVTPTGAAILAALSPVYIDRYEWPGSLGKLGIGAGTKVTKPPNVLRLLLTSGHDEGGR